MSISPVESFLNYFPNPTRHVGASKFLSTSLSSDSTFAGTFSVCHGKDCKARRSKFLIKKLKEELPGWEIQEGEKREKSCVKCAILKRFILTRTFVGGRGVFGRMWDGSKC